MLIMTCRSALTYRKIQTCFCRNLNPDQTDVSILYIGNYDLFYILTDKCSSNRNILPLITE